ncbi:MAG: hypothetical protein H6643_05925 [Caldilineaceae bacterium]|nr:hypothetical protein [Caldilineaceae bacterium]
MQHLLLRLGIISRLRTVNFPYRTGRIGYQLFVTGNENLVRFRDTIAVHFVSPARQAKLDRLSLENVATQSTKDVVPISVKSAVREAKERAGLTWLEINEQCGAVSARIYPTGAAGKNGFARLTIQRLADFFGDDTLQRAGYSDIYWDKIVNIEYVGEEQTYDLKYPTRTTSSPTTSWCTTATPPTTPSSQCRWPPQGAPPVEATAAQPWSSATRRRRSSTLFRSAGAWASTLPPDVNYPPDPRDSAAAAGDAAAGPATPAWLTPFLCPKAAPSASVRFAAVKTWARGLRAIEAPGRWAPFKSLEEFCDRADLRC